MPIDELVFLPGASGNTRFWRPLAARLPARANHRFVGWPGFGGMPADPNVHGIADLAAGLARTLSEPVDLLAQSMGGVVAVLTALAKPGLVKHLVLSVTSGGVDMSELGALDWRQGFRANNPDVPAWFEAESWDLSERIPEITCPVLLLWGDTDPISPVAVGERLASPNAELLVVPGGTHDLVAERVDDILPYIERHLEKPTKLSLTTTPIR